MKCLGWGFSFASNRFRAFESSVRVAGIDIYHLLKVPRNVSRVA